MIDLDQNRSEQTIIAALVQRPDRYLDLRGYEPSDFLAPECRVIYLAASRYHQQAAARGSLRYASADAIERGLKEILRPVPNDRDRTRRNSSVLSAAIALLDSVSSWPAVTDHEYADAKDQLRLQATDLRARDSLMALIDRVDRKQIEGLARAMADAAVRVNPDIGGADTITISESAVTALARYRESKQHGSGAIETPFPLLNSETQGRRSHLWVIGAYSGDGKTTMMAQLAYKAVVDESLGAALFVAEQTKEEIEDLFLLRHSHKFLSGGIDAVRYLNRCLTDREEEVLDKTARDWAEISGRVSITQVPSGTTIDEVRSISESLRARHRVDIIGIDHSGLFATSRRFYEARERMAAVILESKQLAMSFADKAGAWVLLPHQITREGNEQAIRRGYYAMRDLSGTSEAERSADVVLWALQTPETKAVSEIIIGTCKNRRGRPLDYGFRAFQRFSGAAIFPISDA